MAAMVTVSGAEAEVVRRLVLDVRVDQEASFCPAASGGGASDYRMGHQEEASAEEEDGKDGDQALTGTSLLQQLRGHIVLCQ
jgi:hypothetical protein